MAAKKRAKARSRVKSRAKQRAKPTQTRASAQTPAAQAPAPQQASAPQVPVPIPAPVQAPVQIQYVPQACKPKTSTAQQLAIIFAIIIVGGVLLSVFMFAFNGGSPCPQESGYNLYGYCSQDRLATGNPYGGQCRYCPTGYHGEGDVCGDVTCVANTGGGGGTGGGNANTCQPGYCLSNGHCCPSNYRYYCENQCYASSDAARSASNGRCTDFKSVC